MRVIATRCLCFVIPRSSVRAVTRDRIRASATGFQILKRKQSALGRISLRPADAVRDEMTGDGSLLVSEKQYLIRAFFVIPRSGVRAVTRDRIRASATGFQI